MRYLTTLLLFGVISALLIKNADAANYRIGVGRADVTGPPVEVVFMGYANPAQSGEGMHLRQFARSFIVDNDGKRVVFVAIDGAMTSISVKQGVIEKLRQKYGTLYTENNVLLSGTHTHSTPGGFMQYLLYDITTFGFIKETHNAYIEGIYESIDRAHQNIQEGDLYYEQIEVLNANINRSPHSYENNPAAERALYEYDTDKIVTQLRFVDKSNELIGAINWFAVHPVSMNNTNHFVSTDNMGYASILLEKHINKNALPGTGKFVGAFASTNLGDVSPNIMGPKCEFTGEPCDALDSACPEGHGQCFASGPGKDNFESVKIIAGRISDGAIKLLTSSSGHKVSGEVAFVHQFINMTEATGTFFNSSSYEWEYVHGCFPAMGYSFAAGTTDGPGIFDFTQGTTSDNPLWNIARNFLGAPTPEDIECQSPKPILLATGRITVPYEWQPTVLPTQLLRLGDVIIVAAPGEMTTMSGRRLRSHVKEVFAENGENVQVVVAGLSNMYSSYIATPEEYEIQRYEGASTIFGQHTLTLYIQQYERLSKALITNAFVEAGPPMPVLEDRVLSLQTGVLWDGSPSGKRFGDVVRQPNTEYKVGETVNVVFQAGNPRNNLYHERSYFNIEVYRGDDVWEIVYTDASWETLFRWSNTNTILGHSEFEIFWEIAQDTPLGSYRIQHFGASKNILGGISNYFGTTEWFTVTN